MTGPIMRRNHASINDAGRRTATLSPAPASCRAAPKTATGPPPSEDGPVGSFSPGNPARLNHGLRQFLAAAHPFERLRLGVPPLAVTVPVSMRGAAPAHLDLARHKDLYRSLSRLPFRQ